MNRSDARFRGLAAGRLAEGLVRERREYLPVGSRADILSASVPDEPLGEPVRRET